MRISTCWKKSWQRRAEDATADCSDLEAEYEAASGNLNDDREFVRHSNIGGEFMDEAAQQRIAAISQSTAGPVQQA